MLVRQLLLVQSAAVLPPTTGCPPSPSPAGGGGSYKQALPRTPVWSKSLQFPHFVTNIPIPTPKVKCNIFFLRMRELFIAVCSIRRREGPTSISEFAFFPTRTPPRGVALSQTTVTLNAAAVSQPRLFFFSCRWSYLSAIYILIIPHFAEMLLGSPSLQCPAISHLFPS